MEVVSEQGLPVLMSQVCGRCVLAGRTKVKAVTLEHLQVWAEELRPASTAGVKQASTAVRGVVGNRERL